MLTVTEQMWHGWLVGGALTSQADELSEIRIPTCYILGGKDVVVDQAKSLTTCGASLEAVRSC
jgi:hypothetical protein